jgi:hypothetical protein
MNEPLLLRRSERPRADAAAVINAVRTQWLILALAGCALLLGLLERLPF